MISGTLFVIEEWDDERHDWFDSEFFDDEETARTEAKRWQDAEHQAAREDEGEHLHWTCKCRFVHLTQCNGEPVRTLNP